jgi:hypothetical protein
LAAFAPVVLRAQVRYAGPVPGGGLLSAILSEQADDVLADLRRQLRQRIAEARATLSQSESELRLVEQAIAARDGGPPAKGRADRDRDADGRFEGIPRATILAVAATVQPPITPVRVVEAFAGRGETVNLEQIRIALNRIAKDGDLTRIAPSRFVLPGTQLDAAEPGPVRETPRARTRVLGAEISRTSPGTS